MPAKNCTPTLQGKGAAPGSNPLWNGSDLDAVHPFGPYTGMSNRILHNVAYYTLLI